MKEIFDAHVHIWEITEERYRFDPSFGTPPTITAPVGQLLELMNEHHVNRAALIQPGNYGFDANLIVEAVSENPDRFVGLGMVDPSRPDVADQLSAWVDQGLVGMRVLGRWFEAPHIQDLWQRAHDISAVLSFLTGAVDLLPLRGLLDHLPPTKIIIDHFGHRHFDDRNHCQQLLDLARFPNVYIKMSGLYALSKTPHPHRDATWLIRAVYDAFGPQRLLWASDFPYILSSCGYGSCLNLFMEQLAFTSQEDRDWICGKTASTLWSPSEEKLSK